MSLKNLKSGSDIRGTALSGYGEEVNLTDEAVESLVNAFVVFLTKRLAKSELKVAIGHDSRLSADRIMSQATAALKKSGVEIYDSGLCSTPSMYMMTRFPETDCDGAIMITASHHPAQKNGLKFFTKAGGLESRDIDVLIELAEKKEAVEGTKTMLNRKDFLGLYCESLITLVRDKCGADRPLEGFKVVVDAGNGAGGFYADRILSPLGADVSGSQFLNPDGSFPNHTPNPEDKTAMNSIAECVKKNKADLGIIFDTDVDRAAVVDGNGNEINRNKLIALISAILLEEYPSSYIVTDSVTSDGLRKFIERKGGYHHRFKRGYKNVINEAIELNAGGKNAVLAIETSGHAALKENYFLDDGAYLVTRILIKMAQLKKENKSISGLIEDLECPKEEAEIRLNITEENFKEYGGIVIKDLTEYSRNSFSLEPSTFEGVRTNIDFAKGWFLARLSVHDPIMVVNIESAREGGVKTIAKILYAYLSSYRNLDCVQLQRLAL